MRARPARLRFTLLLFAVALLGFVAGLVHAADGLQVPRKGDVCELTRLEGKTLVERRVRVLGSAPLTGDKLGAWIRVLDAEFDAGWLVPAEELRECRS